MYKRNSKCNPSIFARVWVEFWQHPLRFLFESYSHLEFAGVPKLYSDICMYVEETIERRFRRPT